MSQRTPGCARRRRVGERVGKATPARHAAATLASRLLEPSVLDETLRSGLFLVRPAEGDPWEALLPEVFYELQARDALVLFVDLKGRSADPAATLKQCLLTELQVLAAEPAALAQVHLASLQHDTLAAQVTQLVEMRKGTVVLILDHVSRLQGRAGDGFLKALKAARDAVNLRAGATAYFIVIATDPDSSVVRGLASDSGRAFFGAAVEDLRTAGEPVGSDS